jgi:hypothetical protein
MACSCGPKMAPCEAYSSSSLIFIGLVTSSQITSEKRINQFAREYSIDDRRYQIKVEETFRGSLADTIEAHTNEWTCGYEFTTGKRYLIYTHDSKKGPYGVTFCSRTRPIEEAAEDLNYLRVERFTPSGGRIFGSILKDFNTDHSLPADQRYPPMAGIHIVIEGEGSRFELISDEKGQYEVRNLKPGDYSIEIILGRGMYGDGGPRKQTTVIDRCFAKVIFYVRTLP